MRLVSARGAALTQLMRAGRWKFQGSSIIFCLSETKQTAGHISPLFYLLASAKKPPPDRKTHTSRRSLLHKLPRSHRLSAVPLPNLLSSCPQKASGRPCMRLVHTPLAVFRNTVCSALWKRKPDAIQAGGVIHTDVGFISLWKRFLVGICSKKSVRRSKTHTESFTLGSFSEMSLSLSKMVKHFYVPRFKRISSRCNSSMSQIVNQPTQGT